MSEDFDVGTPQESFDVEDGLLNRSASSSPRKFGRAPLPKLSKKSDKTNSKQEAKVLRIFCMILSSLFIVVVVVLLLTNSGSKQNRDASAAAHTGSTYEDGFNMKQNWGSYSPYFDTGATFDGVSKQALSGEFTLPNTCKYKQVHVLHRHGDRFPAEGTAEKMENLAKKLKEMTAKAPLQGSLSWLNDWKYQLKEDLLVGAGVGALFDSGAKFWGSHGRLLYNDAAEELPAWSDDINVWPDGTKRPKPVLRATGQQRIQDSARAWAAGFFGTYGYPSSGVDPLQHYDLVQIPEESNVNNSLAGYFSCPNSDLPGSQTGKERSNEWVDIYLADAATRIQKLLPDLGEITPKEVLAFQDLCVFETAAFGSSAFCGWFTEEEWRGFEYHIDLKFYGESAWGSKTAPASGLPWLAELQARLSNKLIKEPEYGVNVNFDSDPETFPLHQPFYADFTHDSVIVSVLSALQFPFTKHDLSSTKIKVPRQLIVSRLTPFAARLYVEVLECGTGGNTADFVRLKLNDRVLPIGDLKHCDDDDKMGLCPFSDFLKTLDWSLNKLNFDKICFGKA